MSSVGLSEWVLLALIGLIVLGPERLPRIANQLGSWIGQARRMTRVMKRQLEEEIDLEKSNSIKPPGSVTPPADAVEVTENVPANESDDNYSPAHDEQSPGTGVADDDLPDAEEIEIKTPPVADSDDKENKS
jgi:sec-independent protein translocase protein TatB